MEPKEEITIKLLPPNEWRILKKITIIGENGNGIGCIAYTRIMDDLYKINVKSEDDNSYLYAAKQEDYPSDKIDSSILESIKKEYPQSAVINDTIFFNVDQRKIDHIKNCKDSGNGNITFILVPEDEKLRYMLGRNFEFIEQNIVMYSNSKAFTDTFDFIAPLSSKFNWEIAQIQFI